MQERLLHALQTGQEEKNVYARSMDGVQAY